MTDKNLDKLEFLTVGRRGVGKWLLHRYLGEFSSERVNDLHLTLIGTSLFADPLPAYRFDTSPLSVEDALNASWGQIHAVFGEAMIRFHPLRELTDHGREEDPEEDIDDEEEGHYPAGKEAGHAEPG